MAKLIILCLIAVVVCDAGLIPHHIVYSQYPHLNAVYHGHGAMSYQNVQIENHGSVPIPKDLQVDDGDHHPSYVVNDLISSAEAPYIADGSNHNDHVDFQTQYEAKHYGNYNPELEYEYN